MRKSVSGTEAVTLPSLLSDCFIPTVERVRLARSGAMIKAAYAVSYTPVREENTRETASPGSSFRAALFTTENRA